MQRAAVCSTHTVFVSQPFPALLWVGRYFTYFTYLLTYLKKDLWRLLIQVVTCGMTFLLRDHARALKGCMRDAVRMLFSVCLIVFVCVVYRILF